MSNQFAIAAVTRTLRNLLNPIISGDYSEVPEDSRPTAEILITTLPLDKARNGDDSRNQLNLFLYHTAPNTAWRNMNIPQRVRPGETGFPPLALNLHYIITAYGQENNELVAHLLLGMAMGILHDHAILDRDEVETAFALSDLHKQIERIRLNPQSISLDETSKLWTGFQAEYRLSAAYEASVVLIDSLRPSKTPLPVLRRGSEDQGVHTLASPAPILYTVAPPNSKSSADLGDILTITGRSLDSAHLTVRFHNPLLAEPIEIAPLAGSTGSQMQVQIPDPADDPNVPSQWAVGFYTLAIVVQRPDLPPWTTNQLPFALAPQVTSLAPNVVAQGDLPAVLTLTCIPQIRHDQRVTLLFGNQEIPVDTINTPADPTAETTLTATINNVEPGVYVVRLRVDGADSIPILFSDTAPPQFDDDQKVTITS
jgi:hypothetical protein